MLRKDDKRRLATLAKRVWDQPDDVIARVLAFEHLRIASQYYHAGSHIGWLRFEPGKRRSG